MYGDKNLIRRQLLGLDTYDIRKHPASVSKRKPKTDLDAAAILRTKNRP